MELAVQKREIIGKKTNALRRNGLIPAELYGKGIENLHLAIPIKDFNKVFKQAGESSLVNVILANKKYPAMITDVSRDPVTDEILSVDFHQVRLDEKIKIKVPFEFIGIAPVVKEKNGILVKAMHEIEVEALPGNIPHSIPVKLDGLLDIGQSIYIKDLGTIEGVRFLVPGATVIVTATPQITEEEEKALEAEVSPEAVVVETEEKKTERLAKEAEKGIPPKTETPPIRQAGPPAAKK